ncbi:MAG: aminotransferase class I/II-fold pyridoxal phosphate-dependent enzyme [Thaumarchaeota archaeon]|nr:aminotransferase class I/II-fold pyridoxal phosphate-dependent enzyme [Nitrososphaerota archaeon]
MKETREILVESHVDKIVMPENLKVGLMIAEQRKKCADGGCHEEYYALGFGQSPFHVPQPLVDALAKNADQGHYSAAEGIFELRKAIAGFNKRHFGLNVDPNRIVIGPGTKDLLNTLVNIIKGGVIIPSPSWIGYRPQIILTNKHFHTFHLKPESNYRIQPEDLDDFTSKLDEEQHMLVLNNPHNPTGIVYSKKELEKITEVCRSRNILVLADEIYALDTYDMNNFTSMGLVYPEGTFVTNGLSKDRSAGGYRLGSCILPTRSTEKLQKDFKKVAATVYTNVSTPTQYAAIDAYEPNDEIDEYLDITRDIHRIMGHYLSDEWNKVDGIKATRPDGAFYFFADFNELAPDLKKMEVATSNQLGESLLSCPHHLGTVTGDACMLEPDDYGARIAFVDYDGKKTFDNYKQNTPKSSSDELEFVKQNAPMMVKSTDALRGWVSFIKRS